MFRNTKNPYRPMPDKIILERSYFNPIISEVNLRAVANPAKWTVFVFMAADHVDIGPAMFDDLLEMKKMGSDDRINICVFFDGPLLSDTFFARLNVDSTVEEDIIVRFVNVPTHRPGILVETIRNNAKLFPAERHLLILSGHGGGWLGALSDSENYRNYLKSGKIFFNGFNSEEMDRLVHESHDRNMAQIQALLDKNPLNRPYHADVMAYDACLMGNYEALTPVHDLADLLIASEIPVPATGFPYDRVLSHLKANPELTPIELAQALVKETGAYYRHHAHKQNFTQIALQTKALPEFDNKFSAMIRELLLFLQENGFESFQKILSGLKTDRPDHIDLFRFIERLHSAPFSEGVQKSAEAVDACAKEKKLILALESTREELTGLSLYAPTSSQFDSRYLAATERSLPGVALWKAFLYLWYAATDADAFKLNEEAGELQRYFRFVMENWIKASGGSIGSVCPSGKGKYGEKKSK